jgi:hypothetical protein
LLDRYDANWYGYLAKQRLDDLTRGGKTRPLTFRLTRWWAAHWRT